MEKSMKKKLQTQYIIIYIISCIFIIFFGYLFNKYFLKDYQHILILSNIILPLSLITFYFYKIMKNLNNSTSEEILNFTKEQVLIEGKHLEIIPVILFGIGVFFTQISRGEITKKVFPIFMFSLLFGTIIPVVFKNLLFNSKELIQLTFFEDIEFSLASISFSLLISGIIVSIIEYKKLEI